MKHIIDRILLVAIATVSFYSCNKVEPAELYSEQDGLFTYSFTIGEPETRSTIALENNKKVINWDEDDQIGVYTVSAENGTSSNQKGAIDLTKTPNEFKISSKTALVINDWVYTYAPQRYMTNEGYASPTTVQLSIPTKQTQVGTSFKANAMPMAGTPYQVKEALAANTEKSVGNIKMINLGAIIDFKIYTTDSDLADENIKSVSFKSTEPLAGTFEFDLTSVDYSNSETLAINNYTENSVVTEVSEPIALSSTKEQAFDVYMVVAPGSYTGSIIVETDKAKYSFPINTAKNFKRNVILNIGVNLRKDVRQENKPETSYEWNLVTSVDEITVGSEIVIVASEASNAMSQTQNKNNRAVAPIAKNGNKITWSEEELVQVFEVEAGSVNNTVAFKCTNGSLKGEYIAAASSSSNYLHTQDSRDGNASWTISISETGAVATLTANGTNTRNSLRYNPNNGSPMFSCYSADSSTGSSVVLYKKGDSANPDAKAIIPNGELSVSARGEGTDYENAYTLINIDESQEEIMVSSSDNVIDAIADGGTLNFSMAPNYTNQTISGNIMLTLASEPNVTATIPIKQAASSLTVRDNTVTIPANKSEAKFSITSPDFSWVITGADGVNVSVSPQSGSASSSPVEITVSSDIAAGETEQTLVVLTVIRDNNGDDPQKKSVTIKKSAKSNGIEWIKTDISDINDGDYVVVVDEASSSAMSNDKGASTQPLATSVSIVDEKLESVPTNVQFVFKTGEDGVFKFMVPKTSNFLYSTDSNTGLRVGTGTNNTFSIKDGFLYNIGQERYIGVYNNTDWRSYTTIGSNIKSTIIAFYVKTGDDSGQNPDDETDDKSVTYTVTSVSEVEASGDILQVSNASYSQTYSTAGQMTKGHSITLTLSGFAGKTITGASVFVKSNSKGGSGSLTLDIGSTTVANIESSAFNTTSWNGAWSTEFVEKVLTVKEKTVGTNEDITLTIEASANSLYFDSLTLYYK